MRSFLNKTIVLALALSAGSIIGFGQNADNRTPLSRGVSEEEQPRSVREMMSKLRIEEAKKDHDEMLRRGEEALKLSQQIETSVAENKEITKRDRERLEGLERIVKKIRGDLGGDDDDESTESVKTNASATPVERIKELSSITAKFVDELKKTTRFTVSAVAIQSSNTLLKVVRFLRFTNGRPQP